MEIQWSLVLFTVIAGAGAWQFACAAAEGLAGRAPLPTKLESIVAFALLVVGGIMSVTHLKHVDRILEALNHPTSGIFVEAAMIGVLCVLIAIYFIMLVRGSADGPRKVVAGITLVVGIVFTYACGSSYMMDARPAWTTIALPAAYCGTAAAAGAGVNLLLKGVQKQEDSAVSLAGILACICGVLGAALAGAWMAYAGAYLGASDGGTAWGVVAVATSLVVCVCGVAAWRKPATGTGLGAVAACGGVLAAVGLRVVMWLVGTPLMNFFLMPLD